MFLNPSPFYILPSYHLLFSVSRLSNLSFPFSLHMLDLGTILCCSLLYSLPFIVFLCVRDLRTVVAYVGDTNAIIMCVCVCVCLCVCAFLSKYSGILIVSVVVGCGLCCIDIKDMTMTMFFHNLPCGCVSVTEAKGWGTKL